MAKFHDKFWHRDGTPKRCWRCISPSYDWVGLDSIEGQVCEYKYVCSKCNAVLAYWAYGYYDCDHEMTSEAEFKQMRVEYQRWKKREVVFATEQRWANWRRGPKKAVITVDNVPPFD